jgi:hypothetical protein
MDTMDTMCFRLFADLLDVAKTRIFGISVSRALWRDRRNQTRTADISGHSAENLLPDE